MLEQLAFTAYTWVLLSVLSVRSMCVHTASLVRQGVQYADCMHCDSVYSVYRQNHNAYSVHTIVHTPACHRVVSMARDYSTVLKHKQRRAPCALTLLALHLQSSFGGMQCEQLLHTCHTQHQRPHGGTIWRSVRSRCSVLFRHSCVAVSSRLLQQRLDHPACECVWHSTQVVFTLLRCSRWSSCRASRPGSRACTLSVESTPRASELSGIPF